METVSSTFYRIQYPLQFLSKIVAMPLSLFTFSAAFFKKKKIKCPILMHISGLRICLPGQSCSTALPLLLLLHGWSKGILPWGDRSPHQLVSSSQSSYAGTYRFHVTQNWSLWNYSSSFLYLGPPFGCCSLLLFVLICISSIQCWMELRF